MPMLKLGFALEGSSDLDVIPGLARRVVTETFPDIVLAEDSVLRPRKRGHGFVRELPAFAEQLREDGVDVVVAVVDTDDNLVGERLGLLHDAKQACVDMAIAVCIAEGLAVRALEAWLLADEAAIFQVFDGDRASVSFPSPEHDPAPKTALNHIVRVLTAGREVSFVPFAEELVQAVRLPVLRQRCHHFDDFVRNLVNCVREWQRVTASSSVRRR